MVMTQKGKRGQRGQANVPDGEISKARSGSSEGAGRVTGAEKDGGRMVQQDWQGRDH